MNLLGKVAIVTGSSRGIGRGVAIELAKEGANIVINYSKDEEGANKVLKELKEIGITAIAIKKDISSYEACKELIDETIKYFGRIDILVNNAGISKIGLFLDSSKDEIDNLLDINLKGPMYLTKHALPHLINSGNGNIINISSMWGNVGASCEVLYSTSKGGINLFTKSLAKEMAGANIRVNAIAPGVINTEMNEFLSDDEKMNLIEEIPVGRFGESYEIGKMVAFICSDKCTYLTGQIITVDGGMI